MPYIYQTASLPCKICNVRTKFCEASTPLPCIRCAPGLIMQKLPPRGRYDVSRETGDMDHPRREVEHESPGRGLNDAELRNGAIQ